MSLSIAKEALYVPALEEVATVLGNALKKCFTEVSVTVVQCPNLTNPPFGLEAKGLGGSPRLADVGGVSYLLPLVQKDKLYDLKCLATSLDLTNAFIVGSGVGPHPFVGVNSDLITNWTVGDHQSNGSYIVKVDVTSGECKLLKLPESETRFAVTINAFASEGKTSPVLHIKAKKRIAHTNLVSSMREGLEENYGDKVVGLGGTFRLVEGKVKCHVMPDFSNEPLTTNAEIKKWLHFYVMDAPMVFVSTLVSKDPGMDLHLEHSHGFGQDRGGHYYYDTTPDTVEYEGFFNVAEFIYRVDRPPVSFKYSKD